MTELQPLLESSDDDFELALLRSVRAERPGPAGLHDTALALGLAASTAKALAAALPATGALAVGLGAQGVSLPPAAAAGGTLASGAAGVSGALASGAPGSVAVAGGLTGTAGALGAVSLGAIGKSLFGGALMSFVALTAIDRVGSISSPPPASVAPAAVRAAVPVDPRSEAPAVPHVSAVPMNVVAEGAPEAAPAPAVVRGRRRATRVATPVHPAKEARSVVAAPAQAAFTAEPNRASQQAAANASLAEEIRALDQARAALAAGDTNRASQLLDSYAANKPSSTLLQEAALLRVRVLLNRGQRPAAAALARRIIAQHPESAHVESLRRLAAEP